MATLDEGAAAAKVQTPLVPFRLFLLLVPVEREPVRPSWLPLVRRSRCQWE